MAGYIGGTAVVSANGAERKKTYTITGTTTSLTGLSYTVNQVHVFHNGVRLVDGTDFTATNGNSITLTSAAESGDEVVVLSYASFQTSDTVSASQGGTFSGDVTVSGAFTSQGIDDNATSTAMTLDSSGNLLVGKTTTSGSVTGLGLYNSGLLEAVADGDIAATLKRLNSDGEILRFRKNSTTVGSIGSNAGAHLTMGSGDTGLLFNAATDKIHPWNVSTQGIRDNAVDLGVSVSRFKDLYLSGGVYLGGTGSANHLDDYEEGTWTPTVTGQYGAVPSGGADSSSGYYTKIGNVVTATFVLDFADSDGVVVDDRFGMGGLPFTGLDYFNGAGQAFQYGQISTGTNAIWHVIASTSTTFWMYCHHEDGSMNYNSEIRGTVTYRTNS